MIADQAQSSNDRLSHPGPVSVIVPTFRRPEQLRNCLAGLHAQTRIADEIIVIRRMEDHATADYLAQTPGVSVVTVNEPGVLAAMNAGVLASTGSILAFIDDDAVPRPQWLERLTTHLAIHDVGGVGGRDVVHALPDPDSTNSGDVGIITTWGKLIGNHHLGQGQARPVSVLKAVNMAFRREALALPRVLRGTGAQVHFEVAVGLAARNAGWRLIYDPEVLVDHYPGLRFDADRRERPDPAAARYAAYNLVICMVSLRPDIAWRRACYGMAIGDAMTPGLIRAAFAAARGDWPVVRRLAPSLRGQAEAFWRWGRGGGVELVPAVPGGPVTMR